jgi:RimJ/RimL family protein N-acetyltransferase
VDAGGAVTLPGPRLREPSGPIRLETERLVLRELREDDWRPSRAWDADPEAVRYVPHDVLDEEATRRRVAQAIAVAQERPRRQFKLAIERRADAGMIGQILLYVERPEHADAMVGFVTRRDCWGQGYVTEALRRMLDFGFGELGLSRLYGDADPRNSASCRVMEKVGMRREGTLLKNWWLKGEWCDSAVYAIRAEEWPTRAASSAGRGRAD